MSNSPLSDLPAEQLKTALVGLRSRIDDFITVHGAAEVLAGSDSMLASLGVQRLAGAEIIIQDGVELIDAAGVHDDVPIQGSIVYIQLPASKVITAVGFV